MKQTLLFILSKSPHLSLSDAAFDAILTSLLLDQTLHVVLVADAHEILTTLDLAEKLRSFQSLGDMSVYRLNMLEESKDNLSNEVFGPININEHEFQQIIALADKVINF